MLAVAGGGQGYTRPGGYTRLGGYTWFGLVTSKVLCQL